MLALQLWRLAHCEGCGQPLDECMDGDNDGAYRATANRCFGCASIATAAAKFSEDPHRHTLRYKVTKRAKG